ncbi:MAG: hypothetical protein JSS82_03580 [Bacteroidetes bacterium]|nr:hypothetical protein [Bacteroidota bacterium]
MFYGINLPRFIFYRGDCDRNLRSHTMDEEDFKGTSISDDPNEPQPANVESLDDIMRVAQRAMVLAMEQQAEGMRSGFATELRRAKLVADIYPVVVGAMTDSRFCPVEMDPLRVGPEASTEFVRVATRFNSIMKNRDPTQAS